MMWDELGVKDGDGLFVACSGAKIRHLGILGNNSGQYWHSPYGVAGRHVQIKDLDEFASPAMGGAPPDIITLSIGGNDLGDKAGVSDVLNDCAAGGCQRDRWMSKIPDIRLNLLVNLAGLRQKYPDSRILVIGYPVIFGPDVLQPISGDNDFGTAGCGGVPNSVISKSEREWIDNTLIPEMNNAVREAAAQNGATYVDTYNRIGDGHGACAAGEDSWINGFVLPLIHSGHPSQRWHEEVAAIVLDELS
jgi:hypothetical protein